MYLIHTDSTSLTGSCVDVYGKLRTEPRQRRGHTKSRSGCVACKARKVKCDEAHPVCRNCMKRKTECVRQIFTRSASDMDEKRTRQRKNQSLPLDSVYSSHRLLPTISILNHIAHPLQLQLMQNFATCTVNTLITGPDIWLNDLLGICLQHEYLLHAVLMISAIHLSYMTRFQNNGQHHVFRHASLFHLSRTLRLYRDELSQPLTASTSDPIVATSLLLYHYGWASIDSLFDASYAANCSYETEHVTSTCNKKEELVVVDFSRDSLLQLSKGLRNVFMSSSILKDKGGHSAFLKFVQYRPTVSIQAFAEQAMSGLLRTIQSGLISQFAPSNHEAIPESHFYDAIPELALLDTAQMRQDSTDYTSACGEVLRGLALILSLVHVKSSMGSSPEFPDHESSLEEPNTFHIDPQSQSQRRDKRPASWTMEQCTIDKDAFKPTSQTILPDAFSDIARYIFTFPVTFCDSMNELATANDRRVYLMFLYFYHAARYLLPEDTCWWGRDRAMTLETKLESILQQTADIATLFDQSPTCIYTNF